MHKKTITAADFGPDFKWGVGMAAPQNEGAAFEDGKGLSVWDVFARKRNTIKGGARPTVATDFYHRYKDDILLAKALGFSVFRFSIAWSRVLPDGIGKVNKLGIDFYHRVIDECIANGLEPVVTIYHWDLPHALELQGGWTSRDMIKWFSKYVTLLTTHYGKKVKQWIVMNEPFAFTALGYMIGMHAPGKMGTTHVYPAIFNAAYCTAEGGRIIREHCPQAIIGTSFSISETKPYTNSDKDIAAANRADALLNRLFIEPVLGMGFPQLDQFDFLDKLHIATTAWRFIDKLKFDFDYIGLQNYFSVTIKHNPLIPYVSASEVSAKQRKMPHTAIGWEIDPDSFYAMLKRFGSYEGVKQIIVTEGGACFKDHLHHGVVNDQERIDYFRAYLGAVLKAKNEGVNIGGYYAWTLTDNFEWAYGYSTRFGLVHTDFETQLRTVKNSGYWFRDFLQGKAV